MSRAIASVAFPTTGVFGGIVAGGLAAWLFNRYYRISLPDYLAFFAGKRFMVTIEGRDLADTKVLHEFASKVDFGKIAGLK